MIDQYGRKFVLTVIGLVIMVGLPIVYQNLGISESVTQLVLGAVAAGIGTYGITNVMADKYAQPPQVEKKDE